MDQTLGSFQELKSQMGTFEAQLRQSLKSKVHLASSVTLTYKEQFEELKANQQNLIRKLDQLEQKERELKDEIETFRKDTDYVKTDLETKQIKKQQLESQRDALLEESRELDGMLAKKEQEVKQHRERLMRQRQRDSPEVRLYEQLLGLQIDASQPDTLHFKFQNFDDKMISRSCELTLDVSENTFSILSTTPVLNSTEDLSELVDILNDSYDIAQFLAASRAKLISKTIRSE
ncbi:hypothetical protein HG535_0A00880 [Zygotorulaspora mrakii]|uniref:Kinetochore protein SPC25 n=1 Tax=Zygotorulaspora mrakii TaxID=42260 RepID=A0A7H9AWJ8_ZYGMR|nr:uncharacterized protein HG535_0A00880 [Zygotorulaspora mrakii]QLG70149.1 hypothetical protein HG535_0A00880 [Zygotorulaspora mrakii]